MSTNDNYDGRHLRFVGEPAPTGFSPWYQWGSPHVLTASPEDGPVTMAGMLDVSGMTANGQTVVIGLHDADSLRAGDRGEKAEVGIYVTYRDGSFVVGVTDGDAGGGEFIQAATTFAGSEVPDGVLDVTFVVDGRADPATCASDAADIPSADGCMTLTVNGRTLADSYGTIVPTDIVVETELGGGAYPGWYSAYAAGDGPEVGVFFDLTVSPVVLDAPQTAADCRDGGFDAFGFENQGRCIASVRADDNAKRDAKKK
ncbi:MAG: hypothetical protein ACQEXJ_20225 [Myxococcota bacterium]